MIDKKETSIVQKSAPVASVSLGLAGLRIEVTPVHAVEMAARSRGYGAENLPEDAPRLQVRMTEEDIAEEKEHSIEVWTRLGMEIPPVEDEYFEMTALLRKLLPLILDHGVIYMHGSAVCIDGNGVVFTAPSGTGKSTHARLWRERFGDRVVMINDDKPFLRVTENGVFVCGTPWNGKHGLGCQMEAPLRAIVRLRRGETNSIERVDLLEGTRDFYAATCRFRDRDLMQRVLGLLARIVEQVPCYRLSCTMDPEAADTALAGLAEALEAERHEGQGCSPGELLNKRR